MTLVLAAGAHGLALMLVCVLPCLRAAERMAGPIEVVPELECESPGPSAADRIAVSPEGPEAPAEERLGAISDAIPEAPGIPVPDAPAREPVPALRPATARMAGGWVELTTETRSSTAQGDGGGAVVGGAGTGVARPELAGVVRPRYPLAARRRGEEGRVTVRVRVDAVGAAHEARVSHSSGSRDLDQTALEAVAKATFHPARQGGTLVDAECDLVFEFRLEDP
jgi:protein TonB